MNHTTTSLLSSLCLLAAATSQSGPEAARAPSKFGIDVAHDGAVIAESLACRSRFDGAGAGLTVPSTAGDQEADLQLRFLGARRGSTWLPAAPAAAAALTGELVQFEHPGMTERYQVTANGYEQSFVVAERPAGHGDLVIEVGVGGDVVAAPVGRRHQAIEFVHAGERAIRYGEAFAFGRGGDHFPIDTTYDGAGRLSLIVPAALVDSATYPLTIDPVVGPVFNPGGASYSDFAPDTAWDIGHDQYLIVWQRNFSATSHGIRGRVYDGDGNPVSALMYIADGGGDLNRPSVAFANDLSTDGFLVVWEQSGHIQGRRYDYDGNPQAASFVISTPAAGEQDQRPTVSGPGDGAMMVAWDRTFAGENTPRSIRFLDMYWPIPGSPATVNVGPERQIRTVTSGYVRKPRLARSDVRVSFGGQDWFANRLVWDRFFTSPTPGDFDVETCALRVRYPFDFAYVQSPTTLPDASAVGIDEFNCDIGGRASLHQNPTDLQYCVAWEEEADVRARMCSLTGTIGGEIDVRSTNNFEGAPAVGAGHCEFTVAYLEIIPPNEFAVDIRAARVLLDGTVAVTDRPVDLLNGPYQSDLRAASRPILTSSQKQRNTSLLVWYGNTGPAGAQPDIRARFFEPIAPSAGPFGVACPGPLGELPAIGSQGGDAIAGNDQFQFTVTGAPANSLAILVFSNVFTTTPIPGAPGCNLYAGLPLIGILPTVTSPSGFGAVDLPWPCSIPNGAALAFQWAVYTPGHNPFGWIVSNDLDISWSHF